MDLPIHAHILGSVDRERCLISLLLFLLISAALVGRPAIAVQLEESVCGLKEAIYFWLWSTVAGRPNSKRLSGIEGVEDISHTTQDGRTLRGYKLDAGKRPQDKDKTTRGFLLVLQGNAMLADRIIGEYRAYSDLDYDVYIYDYRGYGRSEGKRRLKAIVHDIKEILAGLIARGYERRLVYAMSLGGVFLLNALGAEMKLDKIVIDSSPSRLSGHGCPIEYDPIEHLPDDCSSILFIRGQRDGVVTPAMSRDLAREIENCGAVVIDDPEFGHPFMDADAAIHRRRMQAIQRYLLQ